MFNQMKNRIKNEKGLTLIELLAVIVILAIVAAIAIPAIGNIIDNSRIKAAKSDVVNVISAANIYFTENSDAVSVDKAGLVGFVDAEGILKGATYTVTKGTATTPTSLSVTGKIKVGSRDVGIAGATVDGIDVSKAEPVTGMFEYTK
ncbi:prepilin-type N-terminal cleavage/methylation domain-containing protein [Solibacillus sp. FSL H8-0538]|uniref:prepilin-type N-terminal cleavage/methylation domain-containing protein n=1 Tax=Solibacillus sp. FSL H8-0538 TaxID=2921400 RepID=UPI0030F7B0E8